MKLVIVKNIFVVCGNQVHDSLQFGLALTIKTINVLFVWIAITREWSMLLWMMHIDSELSFSLEGPKDLLKSDPRDPKSRKSSISKNLRRFFLADLRLYSIRFYAL